MQAWDSLRGLAAAAKPPHSRPAPLRPLHNWVGGTLRSPTPPPCIYSTRMHCYRTTDALGCTPTPALTGVAPSPGTRPGNAPPERITRHLPAPPHPAPRPHLPPLRSSAAAGHGCSAPLQVAAAPARARSRVVVGWPRGVKGRNQPWCVLGRMCRWWAGAAAGRPHDPPQHPHLLHKRCQLSAHSVLARPLQRSGVAGVRRQPRLCGARIVLLRGRGAAGRGVRRSTRGPRRLVPRLLILLTTQLERAAPGQTLMCAV